MAFLTAIPQELLSAAQQLEGIVSALAGQNAGAAGSTTAIAPAASDQVSLLQAGIFSTYGTMYQQIATEAQTIQQQFASTLGLSSGSYTETEAVNAAAAGPVDGFLSYIGQLIGGPVTSSGSAGPFGLSSNFANIFNIGGGNWSSAASDLLGLAGGGLLPTDAADAAADAGAADLAGQTAPVGAGAGGMGMGMAPVAGMGGATMVGNKLAVPPSWAAAAPAMTSPATAIRTVGLTGAVPSAGPGGIIPGMPGMGAGARNSAGFGAPRYGVKPIVMPKPGVAV